MNYFDNGGELPELLEPVVIREQQLGLTDEQWALLVEAVNWTIEQCRKDPKYRRTVRKMKARDTKSARILTRQIARSEHYIRARPLLRNGKAWRC